MLFGIGRVNYIINPVSVIYIERRIIMKTKKVKNKHWSEADKKELLEIDIDRDSNVAQLNDKFGRNLTWQSWKAAVRRFKAEKVLKCEDPGAKTVEEPIQKPQGDMIGKVVECVRCKGSPLGEGSRYVVKGYDAYTFELIGVIGHWDRDRFKLSGDSSGMPFFKESWDSLEKAHVADTLSALRKKPLQAVTDLVDKWVMCISNECELYSIGVTEGEKYRIISVVGGESFTLLNNHTVKMSINANWVNRFALCSEVETLSCTACKEAEESVELLEEQIEDACKAHVKEIDGLLKESNTEIIQLKEQLAEFNRIREQYVLNQGASLEDFIEDIGKTYKFALENKNAEIVKLKNKYDVLKEELHAKTLDWESVAARPTSEERELQAEVDILGKHLRDQGRDTDREWARAELAEGRLNFIKKEAFFRLVSQVNKPGWQVLMAMVQSMAIKEESEDDDN